MSLENIKLTFDSEEIRLTFGLVIENKKPKWYSGQIVIRLQLDKQYELMDATLLNELPLKRLQKNYEVGGTVFGVLSASSSFGNSQRLLTTFSPESESADADSMIYRASIDLKEIDWDVRSNATGIVWVGLKWTVQPKSSPLTENANITCSFATPNQTDAQAEYRTQAIWHTTVAPDSDDTFVLPEADVNYIPIEERRKSKEYEGNPQPPIIFLSYARANWAGVYPWTYRLQKDYGYNIWVDTQQIRGGEDWQLSLAEAIQQADAVILMATPDSCESIYCQAEIKHALKYNKLIIPLRFHPKVNSSLLALTGLDSKVNYRDFVDDPEGGFRLLVDMDLPKVHASERQVNPTPLPKPAIIESPYKGLILGERYELIEPIGDDSGQAQVWLARDTKFTDMPIMVVKCFKPHDTRKYEDRFLEEVRSIKALQPHPHIVNIETFDIERGMPYIVMPRMGISLKVPPPKRISNKKQVYLLRLPIYYFTPKINFSDTSISIE